jgi:hypothetical protein
MADDFYVDAARRRLEYIDAMRQQKMAHLAISKARGDYDDAALEIQEIADLDSQRANLLRLHEQHVASQQPQYQAPQTDAEFVAKSPERMDYADVYRIVSKSKYGPPDEAAFKAGIQEAARRRARGE